MIDLHTHSTYSDGTFTPTEIIIEAKSLGLKAVALTDHNSVAGLGEFQSAAENYGINAVSGVELTTCYGNKELHLLGLFIREEHFPSVARFTENYHASKLKSNTDLVRRLNEAGYEIDINSLLIKHPDLNFNRANIASELLKGGYVSSITEAFDKLLGEDKGFYVPAEKPNVIYATSFLKSIGALPVLAHPLKDISEHELREIIPSLIASGLMGIEVMHSSYSSADTELSIGICKEYRLLASGGSDFHGNIKPNVRLGCATEGNFVPFDYYTAMLSAKDRK